MTKEQQFWDWFKSNESKYFFLNQIDDEKEREKLLVEFLEHLQNYSKGLYFQVGGKPDEKQDLIISAEGNTDFFNEVETLVGRSPELEHWNVIAFKPVVEDGGIIEYNRIKLNSEMIYFDPLENKASTQIGLRLYVDNYNPSQKDDFLNAAYLILDNVLGEKSNALDIGYVEVRDSSSVPDKEKYIQLTRLPKYVAWKKAKQIN